MKKLTILKIAQTGNLTFNICDSYFRTYNIPPSCPLILELLNDKDNIPLKMLKEATHKDSGSITSSINTLEKDGFVKRNRNEQDKRSFLITITPKGRETVKIIKAYHEKIENISLMDFTDEEKEQLTEFMVRIESNLEKMK